MKRVNKMLVSIFLMSILIITATIVTSAKDTDIAASVDKNVINPSDVPVAEIEDAKLPTPAEEKARLEKRMKYGEILINQKAINQNKTNIESTINTIPVDISYTNPITGISIFGKSLSTIITAETTTTWLSYSLYLPSTSYVYIDFSGEVSSFINDVNYGMWIDSDLLGAEYNNQVCNTPYCLTGIQRSRSTYLSKGWHTIYITGWADKGYYNEYYVQGYLSITAFPEYTTIVVTSPNGGENWTNGTTKSIRWTKIGQPGANVKIELYKGVVLSSVISAITPNDGIYSWYIPTYTPIGADYKIKITSTTDSKYNDWSNNNFRIY